MVVMEARKFGLAVVDVVVVFGSIEIEEADGVDLLKGAVGLAQPDGLDDGLGGAVGQCPR